MNKKISKKDIIKFICFVIFFVTIVITGIVFSSKIKTIFTFLLQQKAPLAIIPRALISIL